ncbi:MAG: phage holin family protein [Acidobacteria bacterium]|nr:phage holin family protein [Acidobacteriota bacterium]
MRRMLINWLLSALALLAVAHIMPGFVVSGFLSALLAAIVIGLVNGTLGLLLKIVTIPITMLTLGLFWFVINAAMLLLASWITPGFEVQSFFSAFFGALLLSLVNLALRFLVSESPTK